MITRFVVGLMAVACGDALLSRPAYSSEGAATHCSEPQDVGRYFSKKRYVVVPLPVYEAARTELPSPIYDYKPVWVEMYWKAWALAFKNFREPSPGSGFVSQFIDAAFNENIFLWDSSFMTMFTNFGAPVVPGISTLDNFYAKQHDDGEICREIVRDRGLCYSPWVNHDCEPLVSHYGWLDQFASEPLHYSPVTYQGRDLPTANPVFTLEALNHPILAWAELESYRVTGDKGRLEIVWSPLVNYYNALRNYLRQGNGLYMTDWASMDNSPRNQYLKGGGAAIDTSSEMVLFAHNLASIADILGKHAESRRYTREADDLARSINRLMWEPDRGFYFDLTLDGKHVPVKTIAAYWTLIGGVASPKQAEKLVRELLNPKTFGRPNPVPTLAADEPQYDAAGGYWRGSVWAPTTTMIIRGLEEYGYRALAREFAVRYLDLVADVYGKTGTIWENYSPEAREPGRPARPDFVGWSGIGPIMYFLEYGIGLQPNAARNELLWELRSGGRQGCERFRFAGHVSSLVAEPVPGSRDKYHIAVESDGGFTLNVVHDGTSAIFQIKKGHQEFEVH